MERDRSIDLARGLAIVAIVVGHVNRGLISSGLGFDWAPDLDRLLYLFHLSVFAYLSGIFLAPGLSRHGTRDFLTQRTTLFLWLYVVWQVLQVGVKLVTSSLVNTPVSWRNLLSFWIPEGQMWFLPWLVSVTLVVSVWQPWSSHRRAASLGIFAFALAIVFWGVDPLPVFTRGWALLLPFAAGAMLGLQGHRRLFTSGSAPLVAVAGIVGMIVIALATTAIPPTVDTFNRNWTDVGLGMVACLLGSAGLLALAGWLSGLREWRILALLGQRSLEIFLAHIVAASGTRILLMQAGLDAPLAHLLLGTVAGLLASIALWALVRRLGIRGVFDLPRSPRSNSR